MYGTFCLGQMVFCGPNVMWIDARVCFPSLLRFFGRCLTNETLILSISIQILKISNQTAKEQCKHHLACGEAHLFQISGHLNNDRSQSGLEVPLWGRRT